LIGRVNCDRLGKIVGVGLLAMNPTRQAHLPRGEGACSRLTGLALQCEALTK